MIDVKDEILESEERFQITDNDGNILFDDVSIKMITKVLQEATPRNKTLYDSIYDDIFYGHSHFIVGTYIGNDEATQTIELGFTPKAVYVKCQGTTYLGEGAFATIDYPQKTSSNLDSKYSVLEIVENGFVVDKDSTGAYDSNKLNYPYNYIAFK